MTHAIAFRSPGRCSSLLLAIALAACNTAASRAEPDKRPGESQAAGASSAPSAATGVAQAAGPAPAAASAIAAATDSASDSSFEVRLVSAGEAKVGQTARAEVKLTAKPPFHVNQEYPLKFKVEPSEGLTYPRAVIGKDQAKVEQMVATVPVEYVAQSAGKKRVQGMFSFSVCTAERCVLEKRPLALAIEAQ
jgi:hypothetical protein